MIVSIDGPAASGKSTTAKMIAQKLGLIYIDTGAMYRAAALYAHRNNVSMDDFSALEEMMKNVVIEFRAENKVNQIYLNGENVNEEIRTPEITKLSSTIATVKVIRHKLVEMQRILARNHDVILDGRDIGTVVFPDADYKFFLIASIESRAIRRHTELKVKGMEVDIEEIKKEMIWRDKNDSDRAESPLKKADDAIEIDTTKLTIDEQVNLILKVIKEGFE